MTQPLTDIVPTNDAGIHFAIIVNMWLWLMLDPGVTKNDAFWLTLPAEVRRDHVDYMHGSGCQHVLNDCFGRQGGEIMAVGNPEFA